MNSPDPQIKIPVLTSWSLEGIYHSLELMAQNESVTLSWYVLHYRAGDYRFPKIISKEIQPDNQVVMIGAGVHGNEIAGPMTIAVYGKQIIEYAHERDIRLIMYPVRNPTGFGIKRYNIDSPDEKVEIGNNDFLRYVLADGRVVDDLRADEAFTSWGWASEARFRVQLPPETELMHELLKRDPLVQTRAVVDLHQDYLSHDAPARAYHYAFGDLRVYPPIVKRIERVVPVWRNQLIGAGYYGVTETGEMTRDAASQALRSDANGFIVRHDGTWPDLMYRIGEAQGKSIHCITPETTGATPLNLACEVNRIWIFGILDLVSEGR